MRSDRKAPFSTGTGASTKVVSDNFDDLPKDADGNKEYDDAETPEAQSDEAEESESATRFRSLISEFRTVKKEVVVEEWKPSKDPEVDNMGRSFGLGRRKASVARVWVTLSEGEGGVFFINKKRMIDYFVRDFHQNEVLKPLEAINKMGHFHIRCTARGGGLTGQAGAIRLGLARALEAHEPWWRRELKKEGLLTRDARKVERKKPGLKKARKASQWVKR